MEHAIESVISCGTYAYIRPEELPKSLRAQNDGTSKIGAYDAEFDAFRKSLFERVLEETNWNFPLAAERLDLNVKYFYQLCKDLNIKRP